MANVYQISCFVYSKFDPFHEVAYLATLIFDWFFCKAIVRLIFSILSILNILGGTSHARLVPQAVLDHLMVGHNLWQFTASFMVQHPLGGPMLCLCPGFLLIDLSHSDQVSSTWYIWFITCPLCASAQNLSHWWLWHNLSVLCIWGAVIQHCLPYGPGELDAIQMN